ncbi:cytochrome P450 2C23-like isoform X2 [Phyllobates terribilis]|uniref:cytochrome P450 2C23-like isoform X2 n=1 Tax=Phyllobates terribilis TaxID=111132 RepID=UPI003CCAB194
MNAGAMTYLQNVTVVLVGVITFILVFFYWKYAWERKKMPPGPFPLPIVGNFLNIQKDGLVPSLTKMARTYGPIYTVYFGTRPFVVLTGYQIIKEALVEMGDVFLNRGDLPFLGCIFNHAGLTFANGESWTYLRQFSLLTLRDFGMGKKSLEEPLQAEAQHLVNHFKSLNVIDKRFDYSDKKWMDTLADSRKAFHTVSSTWGQLYDTFPGIIQYLPGPHRKTFQLLKSLKDYVKESIKTHQKTLDPACPRDYIDCFLIRMNQEEKNLSTAFHVTNLIETVFDMFIGASEATAITIYFSLLMLIKYPELQDKVHEEIDQVIGQERAPKADDRNHMPYTNALLHEIQRISDVIPMGLIRSTTRDVTFHGYHIPKGTNVIPMLTTVLNDPSLFETPEKFNIKHFLDEEGKFKKNNGFMPFSAGKRACIAESLARLQLFIFITVILQNFTLKSIVDPNDLDISPTESGLENLPPTHKIKFIARS